MVWLADDHFQFPEYAQTDESGIIAIGGNIQPETLQVAYNRGIFPWYNEDEPILWHCPDPRFVLFPKELYISKSMKKVLESKQFQYTVNQNFLEVILSCRRINRKGQDGTWLSHTLIDSMLQLHEKGIAKSVEVWQENDLVGGLYGIEVNSIFCGESMFAKVSNASKFGFISFVKASSYSLIDCQSHTQHLESLGARHISRELFLEILNRK